MEIPSSTMAEQISLHLCNIRLNAAFKHTDLVHIISVDPRPGILIEIPFSLVPHYRLDQPNLPAEELVLDLQNARVGFITNHAVYNTQGTNVTLSSNPEPLLHDPLFGENGHSPASAETDSLPDIGQLFPDLQDVLGDIPL